MHKWPIIYKFFFYERTSVSHFILVNVKDYTLQILLAMSIRSTLLFARRHNIALSWQRYIILDIIENKKARGKKCNGISAHFKEGERRMSLYLWENCARKFWDKAVGREHPGRMRGYLRGISENLREKSHVLIWRVLATRNTAE